MVVLKLELAETFNLETVWTKPHNGSGDHHNLLEITVLYYVA